MFIVISIIVLYSLYHLLSSCSTIETIPSTKLYADFGDNTYKNVPDVLVAPVSRWSPLFATLGIDNIFLAHQQILCRIKLSNALYDICHDDFNCSLFLLLVYLLSSLAFLYLQLPINEFSSPPLSSFTTVT